MKILKFIWAIYCYIIISIIVIYSSIIVFVTSLIWGKKARKFNLTLCCDISCPLILFFCFIRLKNHNRDSLEPNKAYVVVSNHNSFMDIFTHSASMPYKNKFSFLSKKEVGDYPVFGIIAKNLAILMDRNNTSSRIKTFKFLKKVLNEGISILIYPEGTKNKTDEPLLDFFDGAFKLAKDMKLPLVINTLVGMKKINNTSEFINMWPGRIDSYYEDPIDISNLTIDEVKDITRQKMLARLK